jgi:hypothetical protein
MTSLAVNSLAAKGTTVFAGTGGGGVLMRRDTDTSWRSTALGGSINVIALSGQSLLVGQSGNGVYVSTNEGANWSFGSGTEGGLDGNFIQSFASLPRLMFAGSDGKGMYRSINGGRFWSKVNEPPPMPRINQGLPDLHVHACMASDTSVFIGTGSGVFVTRDTGDNWQLSNDGFGSHTVISFLATDVALIAGTGDGGVFVSTDHGLHWKSANAGMFATKVNALATDGQNLYAGTALGGVQRRSLAEMITTLGVAEHLNLPSGFSLEQNYPNPFNPSTTISFTLQTEGIVRLIVYDVLGREIDRLVDGRVAPGNHSVEWRPRSASGVYFYRMEVGPPRGSISLMTVTKKMVLLK